MVCSVTTDSTVSGMSSMIRVRVRWQRFTGPPQSGQHSSRCVARWLMATGGFRRAPGCPFLAPGFFARFEAAGFW